MRLIDADRYIAENAIDDWLYDVSVARFNILTPTVKAIPEVVYNKRLKADMVAMLTEIQLEVEELRLDRLLFSRGYECYGHEDKTPTEIQQECSDIIQQKINELKGDQEGEE